MITNFKHIIRYIFLLVCILSCTKEEEKNYLFEVLPSDTTGITFGNTLLHTPELNILTYLYYYNGAGVAVGDFNNDGLEDLYFVANQSSNRFYLNQGNFKFKEATKTANLTDTSDWSTGVTTVDINNDGLLDIYICKVGGYKNLKGKNSLYINQGIDDHGIPSFQEQAKTYNLDISGFSTQASFFDYDRDGDLDMYLLNHSVHPNRTYGRGTKRNQVDSLSGDRLYRNDQGTYYDVSEEAGIFQGAIGYGLGIATSDVNNDGYPDIYIGNDFFENDYLYINQKNGTFKEIITTGTKNIQHTSHFSMGVDIADINNDGLTDIVSLDMLPEELETYKSSGTEYGYTIYNQYLKNGYYPQYMQNTLQLNRGNTNFSEIAFFSGIAATEWSWTPLLADYDNDGYKDVFISNGIQGATNDMDFISFIANDNIQKKINQGMTQEDLSFIKELPDKKTNNYFYRNTGNLTFEDMSDLWSENLPSYSNGAVYADLDNDGDLDIITNNINSSAFIYKNQSDTLFYDHKYIKVRLKGTPNNRNAIGAKVTVFTDEGIQVTENFPTRGYLSSVTSDVHFGLGNTTQIDSIRIRWPDGLQSIHKNITVNSTIVLDRDRTSLGIANPEKQISLIKNDTLHIPFKHQDYETKDFSFEPLAPFAGSNEGPHLTVIDANKDTLEDIFIPGGRFKAGQLLIQQPQGTFEYSKQPDFELDQRSEDIDQCFFDADQDGDLDIVIVSGGNEEPIEYINKPRLYLNHNGTFEKYALAFPDIEINASSVQISDIDQDGDQDILITSHSVPKAYGETPKNYLFENDGQGNFKDITTQKAPILETIGQVYEAKFADLNTDGYPDLVMAGHYMPITLLINDTQGNFSQDNNSSLQQTNGWWNCIEVADMDNDGDLDIIAGNWGMNSRLQASVEEPIQLYRNDFDDNGKIDPIVTYFYTSKETPIATKDELVKQIPKLNKKYLSYDAFAQADVTDYFSASKIDQAIKKQVFTLQTIYFENTGNLNFIAHALPKEVQLSSVHDILISDINQDSYPDIILGGNTYEISTQLSRLDASFGVLLLNNEKGGFETSLQSDFSVKGAVRSISEIKIKESTYFLFGVNNDSLQVVKKIKKQHE